MSESFKDNCLINREDAIKWVRHHYQGHWPSHTKGPGPNGWKWHVFHSPYKLVEYRLVHNDFDSIKQYDVYQKVR